jgi:hypothetical protein
MRSATSTRRASHPHMFTTMFGVVRRSRRHDSHFKTNVYWPNSSESFDPELAWHGAYCTKLQVSDTIGISRHKRWK